MDDRTGRQVNIWQHSAGMCSDNYCEKIVTEQALADNLNCQSKRVHVYKTCNKLLIIIMK